jgi:hypothetical protein
LRERGPGGQKRTKWPHLAFLFARERSRQSTLTGQFGAYSKWQNTDLQL